MMGRCPLNFGASLFPALTALFITLTGCLSVALALTWPPPNESKSIPYISDAHYSIEQSPVFSALIATTGVLFLLTAISSYIAICNRYYRAGCELQNGCARKVFQAVSKASLVSGCISGICIILTGALYSGFQIHFVMAIISGAALVIWTAVVTGMLNMVSDTTRLLIKAGVWFMVLCVTSLFGSMIAFAGLFARYGDAKSVIILEYLIVGIASVFLLVLSAQLHNFKLVLMAREKTEEKLPL